MPRAPRSAAPAAAPAAWSAGRRATQQRHYQDVEPLFLKTRLCKFHSVGVCSRGDSCSFAHGQKELSPLPDLSRTQLCPHLLKTGHCPDGNACNFAHNKKELRPRPAKSKTDEWGNSPKDLADETTASLEEAGDRLPGEPAFTPLSPEAPMYQHWQQPDGSQMMFTFMPMSPMMVAGVPFADSMWQEAGYDSELYCPSDVSDWNPQSLELEDPTSASLYHAMSETSVTEDDSAGSVRGDAQSKEKPPLREEAQGVSDGSTCFNSDCSDGEGDWTVAVGVKNTFLEFGDRPPRNLRRVRSFPALELA